jgi:hypothetical protein
MKYQLGVNSVVRKKATPKVNLGNIPKNYESPFYSGQEKNYLGTGENYKTFGGYLDTKRGSFGAETWLDQANNLSPSIYGTYSKEIKPNLSLDASVGINDKYVGLGLTKTFSKGGVSLKTNTKTVKQDGSKKLKALSKKHLGDIYESETNNSQGFDYWKEKFMKDNNLSEEQAINLIDDIRNEQRLRGVSDKIYKYKNPLVKSSESFVPEYTPPYNKYVDMKTLNAKKPQKSVMGEDYFVSGAKSVKQYRGDENLPEAKKGMKNCGCKHPKSKYKYGTGALTIPEGSAIVTANGGKNMQALMAYKKGNYKLLNSIIEDMPEDNVNKKENGTNNLDVLKKKYSWFNPFTAANTSIGGISRTTGQTTTLDPANNESAYNRLDEVIREAEGKGINIQDMESLQGYIYDTMSDDRKKELWNKYGPTAKESNLSQEEFMALSDAEKRKIFVDKMAGARTMFGLEKPVKNVEPNIKPQSLKENLDKNKLPEDKNKFGRRGFDIPSLAEIGAKASILSQGIEGVPENYLNLDRYSYASQLPKTLREIQLSEQAGRETARDVVGGDAGRYLAQAGNLSAARMKAANDAVVQDTLARQDILNKNVDLSNVELQTNRGLKDQYSQQRAANRGAYNNMLVSLGQSVDTATDVSRLMSNQRAADNQRLSILKSMSDSGNYDIVTNPDGTISYSVKQFPKTTTVSDTKEEGKKRGAKKLKTYKRR